MASDFSLATLIELVSKEADQASARLGTAMQAEEEAGRKLALLEHYRENYQSNCQQHMESGLSIWKYRNFQAFLDNIERAIDSQKDVRRRAQETVEDMRHAWQEIERKRLSYQLLDEQAARRKLSMENKREQKLTDEHATRQHRQNQKS